MKKVDRVVALIKALTIPELVELHKRLGEFPNWPPTEAAGVPAKPKPPLRGRAAQAAKRKP